MRTVHVNAGRPYDAVIGAGVWDSLGERLRQLSSGGVVAVISDTNVAALYGEPVLRRLEAAGFRAALYAFPPGEEHKALDTLAGILEFLAARDLTGSDLVLALGGGISGDVAGFAAAVYKRGIPFVSLPTTLLAMVDASVGGKMGVNLSAGKNLAGAFWQPSLVLCDPDALQTLPEREFTNGMAEVVKHGVLGDPALFSMVAEGARGSDFEEIISRNISLKARFVAADERDRGERRKLNLGHTIGHAIELCSDYSVSHGEAVAVGMVRISRAAERLGVAESGTAAAITAALRANGLPTETDIPAKTLLAAMRQDKKRGGGTIDLILPVRIGECVIRKTELDELPMFLEG